MGKAVVVMQGAAGSCAWGVFSGRRKEVLFLPGACALSFMALAGLSPLPLPADGPVSFQSCLKMDDENHAMTAAWVSGTKM